MGANDGNSGNSNVRGRDMSIEEFPPDQQEVSVDMGPTNPALQRVPESHLQEGSLSFIERRARQEALNSEEKDGHVTIYDSEDDEGAEGQECGTTTFDPAVLSNISTAVHGLSFQDHYEQLVTEVNTGFPLPNPIIGDHLGSLVNGITETMKTHGKTFTTTQIPKYISQDETLGFAKTMITDGSLYAVVAIKYSNQGLEEVTVKTHFKAAAKSDAVDMMSYVGRPEGFPEMTQDRYSEQDNNSYLLTTVLPNEREEPLQLSEDAINNTAEFVLCSYKAAEMLKIVEKPQNQS